jgi:hypothetical protein
MMLVLKTGHGVPPGPNRIRHMNVKQTKQAIKALGMTAVHVEGEWRINYPNGSEATAYYTDDNADALATATDMARKGSRS